MRVITWSSGNGDTIDICPRCEARLEADRKWPKDARGQEYAQVSHGLHDGECQVEDHRAAGRPALNPQGGKTTVARIRLTDANLEEVGRLIESGRGSNVSEVVRALLDESAARRG